MKIEISHNPFLVETTVKVDEVENISLKDKFSGRLQMWVETMLSEIYENLGQPDHIELFFKGVDADYQDVQIASEQAKRKFGLEIDLQHQKVSSVEERVVLLDQMIQEVRSAPIEGVSIEGLEAAYRNSMDSDFNMQVIATMSSGKSTVINSLLGTELLPAANQATTARIARIYDEDALSGKGFEGECLDDQGQPIHERQKVNSEILAGWNNQQEVREIKIYGDIPAIQQSTHTRLVLTDTPGPNNSQDSDHGHVTESALQDKKMPMIVYVLNGEQLGIKDDKNLLNQVCKARSQSGKQSSERFIFLVNKVDKYDPEKKAETVEGVLDNVLRYLASNGIQEPILMPVSAQMVLLARKKINDESMTRAEKGDLNKFTDMFVEEKVMHLLQYMNVSPSVKRSIGQQLAGIADSDLSDDEKNLKTAMIHSGIPVLEAMINEYLIKYSMPSRIAAAYESIKKYLDDLSQMQDEYAAMARASEKDKEKAEQSIQAVGEKIKSGEVAEDFRKTIEKEPVKVANELRLQILETGKKAEDKIHELLADIAGEVSSETLAERKIAEAKEAYQYLRNETIVKIESLGKKAYQSEISFLKSQFKELVSGLFDVTGKEFSFSISGALLPSMEAEIDAPSLNDAKYSREVKVDEKKVWFGDNSKWYNPFSWRETRDVHRTETGFDLDIISGQLQASCLEDNQELIQAAISHLEKKIKETRTDFIVKVKTTLESSVTAQLAEMNKVVSDKQRAEEKLKEAEAALAWIESFTEKLKPVYEL